MSTSARKMARSSPLPPLALIEHTDFGELGIPWYDEELDLAQGRPHFEMVTFFGDMLKRIAEMGGYGILGDNPIWYWEDGKQKVFYADFALVETDDDDIIARVTADHLLLACEIVTTSHPAKLKKDTETQFRRNERHGIPEFLLIYPDLDDERVLEWFTLVDGAYVQMSPHDGRYASRAVPGFVIQPLPRDTWPRGQKFRVSYRDKTFRPSLEEHLMAEREHRRAEQERQRAEQERQRAEQEHQRAEQEHQRAEKMAAKLRALGIDPDAL